MRSRPFELSYIHHYNPLLIANADFIEEFPCLVHKLSVILTLLIINRSEKWGKKCTSRGL